MLIHKTSHVITHDLVFVTTVPITVCALTAQMTHHIGKLFSNNKQNTQRMNNALKVMKDITSEIVSLENKFILCCKVSGH
jgi:hypothetical protein